MRRDYKLLSHKFSADPDMTLDVARMENTPSPIVANTMAAQLALVSVSSSVIKLQTRAAPILIPAHYPLIQLGFNLSLTSELAARWLVLSLLPAAQFLTQAAEQCLSVEIALNSLPVSCSPATLHTAHC